VCTLKYLYMRMHTHTLALCPSMLHVRVLCATLILCMPCIRKCNPTPFQHALRVRLCEISIV